ncbi:MAG: S8 family serine peptidase [candidate division Zixibacteria bacterium]|nr:S8 family serine peptidase [candidate division Zixibacteria bacterium]
MKKAFQITIVGTWLLAFVLTPSVFGNATFLKKQVKSGRWNAQKIEYVDREILFMIKSEQNPAEVKSYLAKSNLSLTRELDRFGFGKITLAQGKNIFPVIERMQKTGLFLYVEPNMIDRTGLEPNDPGYKWQWGLNNLGWRTYQPPSLVPSNSETQTKWGLSKFDETSPGHKSDADVDAPEAWDHTTGSSGVIVSVLDSGIPMLSGSLSHPDLNDPAKIILGQDLVGDGEGVRDTRGHGTHVTGIISAETNNGVGVAGVSWNCRIMVNQVFNTNGQATHEAFRDGMIYSVDNRANVVNYSGGGSHSDTKVQGVAYANTHNVLLVACAGNSGGGPVWYPAGYSGYFRNVIGVSSTDHTDHVSEFSSIGNGVCVAAPGGYGGVFDYDDIYSTMPNYYVTLNGYGITQNYGYCFGTSMASPMVAGVAALILAVDSSFVPTEVREIIEETADEVGGYYYDPATGKSSELGHGRVNAYDAVIRAMMPYGGPVWHVSSNGNDTTGNGNAYHPFATIAKGIRRASNGDTVLVAPGTYCENVNFLGKGIVVASEFVLNGDTSKISQTIIDGSQPSHPDTGSVVLFCSGEDSTSEIKGFTIRNGSGTVVSALPDTLRVSAGGGILCYYGSSPTISNNIIFSDSAAWGGGIGCERYSSPKIIDNKILNNVSLWTGGGIYCYESSPSIVGNEIIGNTVVQYYGGGIYCQDTSDAQIIDNVIDGNSAGLHGGGIYIEDSSPLVRKNNILGNTAVGEGGGIHCRLIGSIVYYPLIDSNTISNNTSLNGAGIGCWSYNGVNCGLTIAHNTISDNIAERAGGGIFSDGECSPTILGNIITGNYAEHNGGGIYIGEHSNPLISANTISYNSTSELGEHDAGGGIDLRDGCNGTIEDNDISHNRSNAGGGIHFAGFCTTKLISNVISNNAAGWGGGIYAVYSSIEIINNTFDSDSAWRKGGAIYLWNLGSPLISNNIISNNLDGCGIYAEVATPLVTFNCFWDNLDSNFYGCPPGVGDTSWGKNYNGTPCDGFYNIIKGPGFFDPADHDYHLSCKSPCIDAGDPSSSKDPDSTIVDMGAYYCHMYPHFKLEVCDSQQIGNPWGMNQFGGITWDGYYLWYGGNELACQSDIYKRSRNMDTVLTHFTIPFWHDSLRIRGLAWKDGNLYVADYLGKILKLDSSGEILQIYQTPLTTITGMTLKGSQFWVSHAETYTIKRLNDNFSQVVETITPSNPYKTYLCGLTWDDLRNCFWFCDIDCDAIYQMEADGTVLRRYTYSGMDRVRNVADLNGELFVIDDAEDYQPPPFRMIYRLSIGPCSYPQLPSCLEPEKEAEPQFTLANYPNPFNPDTKITYTLPIDCKVKLEIYNILGRKVKTLVDDFEAAGHKTVRWDGTNESGDQVASGILFYKLEAGEFTATKKMVLVR